ncbi:glycoside hydrolase family 3 C-terminal domain-containing protein [Bacteroides eggerthii]|uniref:glycoside hydrolase family 3 C-terminal domain-containing protein n=1 Tax=Bacteroides eggerthii TaxID=28111 RepID=UPI0022E5CFA2|nr:glycoside hydrolase family 3 C-terminal domain-containing protein [Bacteroides eggerthii]
MNCKKHFWIVALFVTCNVMAQGQYPFRNPELSIDQRVDDLVSRLTLEEKVKQMLNNTPSIERLGIPAYNWWNECLHGVGRSEYKVTVFPQAIGMAASWDDVLLKQVASSIAEEGRAIYNDAQRKKNYSQYHALTYWTPNINIFRDPRWGRGQETYGEDPFLTGKMGKAFVLGLQGDNPYYLKASACAKHYAVHSGPESLRHIFNADVTTYDLWDTYLPAFRDLVVDAKVSGVMCAYNAFQGQPCCGNDLLMQAILRDKWQFKGYVTSDCGAIDDFYRHHKTHPNAESAAADAVFHGTDLDCGQEAYMALIKAVREGIITERQVDVSLKRLFSIRFRLGLFDPLDKVPYSNIPISVLECARHQELAKRMAQESIVLLKNRKRLLPLSKDKFKKIVVMGPNANNKDALLGNYNGVPTRMLTPLQAIRERVGDEAEVLFVKGPDHVDVATDEMLQQWVAQVKGADIVIFIGGISPQLEGEEMLVSKDGFSGGDRTTIALPAVQTEMMKALAVERIPTVFVMMTGSALAIPWEANHVPAILNAWYGGQYGGEAIADVLFGDYNPSGKLPVTFYAKDSDLPDFNSYDMAGRTYRYFQGKALYPFGYGLSYTDFAYSSLQIPRKCNQTDKEIKVEVTVKNKGKLAGEEVVQLYISHPGQKVLVPLASLKGFQRVHLKAGESKKLVFLLSDRDLACVDENGHLTMLPGDISIFIGGSSPVPTLTDSLTGVKGIMRMEVVQK